MITRGREKDHDDALLMEHRFPIGWLMAGLILAGNVISAVLMLRVLA